MVVDSVRRLTIKFQKISEAIELLKCQKSNLLCEHIKFWGKVSCEYEEKYQPETMSYGQWEDMRQKAREHGFGVEPIASPEFLHHQGIPIMMSASERHIDLKKRRFSFAQRIYGRTTIQIIIGENVESWSEIEYATSLEQLEEIFDIKTYSEWSDIKKQLFETAKKELQEYWEKNNNLQLKLEELKNEKKEILAELNEIYKLCLEILKP